MGGMKRYAVRELDGTSSWQTIKAESPREAYEKLKESLNREVGQSEVIDNLGNRFIYPIPSENEGSTDPTPSENAGYTDRVSENHFSTSSPLTDQKLDNIYKQLKKITWILFIGVLYIMGVNSGVIPTR